MNSEKQFTEYKIIDTTITPVYEGAPIETHPEDQLGGAEPPQKTHLLLASPLPTANQCLIADYDVQNKTLSIGSNVGGSNALIVTLEGEVLTTQGPPPMSIADNFKARAELNGYEVVLTSIWNIETSEGEFIENWSDVIMLEG